MEPSKGLPSCRVQGKLKRSGLIFVCPAKVGQLDAESFKRNRSGGGGKNGIECFRLISLHFPFISRMSCHLPHRVPITAEAKHNL